MASTNAKIAKQLEKKRKEIQEHQEARRRIQTEMDLQDLKSKRAENELQQLARDLTLGGPQSEPTTPPEHKHKHASFPLGMTSNRYSTQSLMSSNAPFALSTRSSRSSSQLPASHSMSALPTQSVPGSRRNSDEEEDVDYGFDVPSSQPLTGRK
jgi:hypothetical protein